MIIATLIAAGKLDRDRIHQAATVLEDSRLHLHGWSWLDEGDAADIEIDGGDVGAIRRLLEGALPETDVVVQYIPWLEAPEPPHAVSTNAADATMAVTGASRFHLFTPYLPQGRLALTFSAAP